MKKRDDESINYKDDCNKYLNFSKTIRYGPREYLSWFFRKYTSFLFVSVDLLQMLEFNLTVTFPAASLLTVILALVGKSYKFYFT